MVVAAKHLTWCTVCEREVGASPNWNRWQADQSTEWRVSRHAPTPRNNTTKARRGICRGSSLTIKPEVVWPATAIA